MLLTLVGPAAALAGCEGDGEEDRPDQPLAWLGEPQLFTPPTLPKDRVLTGRLQARSDADVRLETKELVLVDARGERVPATAIFLPGFSRGLHPPTRQPRGGPSQLEQRRTGRIARIEPGGSVPLTMSWRERRRSGAPVRVAYGAGSLPIPGR